MAKIIGYLILIIIIITFIRLIISFIFSHTLISIGILLIFIFGIYALYKKGDNILKSKESEQNIDFKDSLKTEVPSPIRETRHKSIIYNKNNLNKSTIKKIAKQYGVDIYTLEKYVENFNKYNESIFVITDDMNIMNIWKKWPIILLDSKEQYWRRRNSASTKCIYLNYHNLEGAFVGSDKEIYFTNLKECTCMDFTRQNLPCKHMYRIFDEFVKGTDDYFNSDIFSIESLQKLKNINTNSTKQYMELLENNKFDYIVDFKQKAYVRELLENDLINISPELDFNKFLNKLTKNEIIEILKKFEVVNIKTSLKKQELIDWSIENYIDIFKKNYKGLVHITPKT